MRVAVGVLFLTQAALVYEVISQGVELVEQSERLDVLTGALLEFARP